MTLGYLNEKILADLKQRKAAFDIFREENRQVLGNMSDLYDKLMRNLAQHAVGIASMAFNEGKNSLADQICRYTRLVYPEVIKTRAWRALQFKRMLGLPLSTALRRWLSLGTHLKVRKHHNCT